MKVRIKYQTTVLATCAALSWPQVTYAANAVVDWNAIAASTIATAPSRSGVGSPVLYLDMAVVQVAVYDAVQAFNGTFKPSFSRADHRRFWLTGGGDS